MSDRYIMNALDYYKKRVKEIAKYGGYIVKSSVMLEGYTYGIEWLWEDYKPEEHQIISAEEEVDVKPGAVLYTITLLMKEVI